jgi:hypothetical protein
VTSAAPKPTEEVTQFARLRARLAEWTVRSSRAFLLGLVFACGVEVLLDWNATLMEINVLRNTVRLKGENYVAILGKASDDELAARDRAGLERLSNGIFDDPDAVYVRFTDAKAAMVWDKLKPGFAETFQRRGNTLSFVAQYESLMNRDTQRALRDPELLKSHVANSRYKDFAQAWTDATARALAAFVPPARSSVHAGVVVYEDRLHDENHEKDDRVSYAIGTVLGEDGNDVGTVIVAFDMEATNSAVRFKYIKFTGLCSFFVALILAQNIVSRRTKLRMLAMNAKHDAAKTALREAMPGGDVRCGELAAYGAVDQARGALDGMLWTAASEGDSLLLLVIDPDGDGVDAAAVALYVAQTFHNRRAAGRRPILEDELRALGEGASGIPLARPLGMLLLRVESRTGAYRALCGGLVQLRILGPRGAEVPGLDPLDGELPAGILGPVSCATGVLEVGQSIVAVCADPAKVAQPAFCDGVVRYLARTHEKDQPVPVQDTATWARGKTGADSDIAIVAINRQDGSSC